MEELKKKIEDFLNFFGFVFGYETEDEIRARYEDENNEFYFRPHIEAIYCMAYHPVFRIFWAICLYEDTEGFFWVGSQKPAQKRQRLCHNFNAWDIAQRKYAVRKSLEDFLFWEVKFSLPINLMGKNGLLVKIYPAINESDRQGNKINGFSLSSCDDEKFDNAFPFEDANFMDLWFAYANRKIQLDILLEYLVEKNSDFYPFLENHHS